MTPISHVFLELDKPLQDEVILANGQVLYKAADFDVEWSATSVGKVAAIPEKIKNKLGVEENSEVAFSFNVVSERSFPPDSEVFQPNYDHPLLQRYYNGRGEVLQIVAIPATLQGNLRWICTYSTRVGFVDGCDTKSEATMERWKSQFSFSNNAKFVFKNALDTDDGKVVWKATEEDILAKKVNGEVKSVGSRVILKPIKIDIKKRVELMDGGAPLPFQTVFIKPTDRGEALEDYPQLGIKKGDVVSFQEQYREVYQMWGEEYYLLRPRRCVGIWINEQIKA